MLPPTYCQRICACPSHTLPGHQQQLDLPISQLSHDQLATVLSNLPLFGFQRDQLCSRIACYASSSCAMFVHLCSDRCNASCLTVAEIWEYDENLDKIQYSNHFFLCWDQISSYIILHHVFFSCLTSLTSSEGQKKFFYIWSLAEFWGKQQPCPAPSQLVWRKGRTRVNIEARIDIELYIEQQQACDYHCAGSATWISLK